VSAEPYSGEVPTEERVAVEERLLGNASRPWSRRARWAWATTSPTSVRRALPGAGSVVAYYQQVGRAGRGVEHADVVLLRGAEDRRIQDFFIEQAFPRASTSPWCSSSSRRPATRA
jgi:ATP-dependent DNA helicase RecQ